MRYGKTDPFYQSSEWRLLRKSVLAKHKSECQYCKAKGIYTKATHVHHEFHRDKYPQHELDEYVVWEGKQVRNLVPVCADCHMRAHDYQHERKAPLTEEKW